jgi:hypothetical protein
METIVHNICDLSGDKRAAAEQLVGHRLGEDQQLVIQIVTAGAPCAAASEGKLPDWCNVYEGLTEAEIDQIERSIMRSQGSRSFP